MLGALKISRIKTMRLWVLRSVIRSEISGKSDASTRDGPKFFRSTLGDSKRFRQMYIVAVNNLLCTSVSRVHLARFSRPPSELSSYVRIS